MDGLVRGKAVPEQPVGDRGHFVRIGLAPHREAQPQKHVRAHQSPGDDLESERRFIRAQLAPLLCFRKARRDPQPARYLPPTYAAGVLQLLDELGIDRAVFVGTSLGGLVTMLVAATQPQRIAATILNDVGPELDQRGLDRIRSYVGKPVRFGGWDEAARYISAINRGLPASNSHDDWLRAARRLCKEDGDGVVFDYDMAIAEPFNERNDGAVGFDMWPLFRQLAGAPLLIVNGELSDLLSPAAAQAMVEAHPGAELATVPGVGHAPELNEPEAVAAIDRLLERVG